MTGFRERVRGRRLGERSIRRRAPGRQPVVCNPPTDTEAAIVRIVAQTYPRSGNQLEAAARMAARLGWAAASAMRGEKT